MALANLARPTAISLRGDGVHVAHHILSPPMGAGMDGWFPVAFGCHCFRTLLCLWLWAIWWWAQGSRESLWPLRPSRGTQGLSVRENTYLSIYLSIYIYIYIYIFVDNDCHGPLLGKTL